MTGRIIQFGTSRFLQAHVDLFVHQARQAGQAIGPITVVKTTPGQDRAGRIQALKRGLPYPVHIRGIAAGRQVDERIHVASVDQAFGAHDEWPAVVRCFAREAEIAVSNVGDRGYESFAEDAGHDFTSSAPPRGFPAKLLALLLARFREGGKPLLFLPTELVSDNGFRLAGIVSNLAMGSRQPDAFRVWLAQSVNFADTLVDRIVSESIEPIGAVAEPYALWAIRGTFSDPFNHPSVRVVDDVGPFERLKIYVLNLGHTVLADRWLQEKRPSGETVRAMLGDPAVTRHLMSIYEDEVVPGFARHAMEPEAHVFVETTVERLRNPFLDHRLADIAQNHSAKLERRIAAFLDWVRASDPNFDAPRLSTLLRIT